MLADTGFVALTHGLEFSAILATTRGEKPSVAQIGADDVSRDVIGKPVSDALLQMTAELEEGALLTIDPNGTRLRSCRHTSDRPSGFGSERQMRAGVCTT